MDTPLDGSEGANELDDGDPLGAEPEIHTFLIADIRGYTRFTEEHGDEAAAQLAGRFAAVTREGVTTRGGAIADLRGDEALAVFGSARQALRAAVELQVRFEEETRADPDLPLRVGIGVDSGEAVPIDGGYRGAALNVAARLCGLAHAGEVIATDSVVHLAGRLKGGQVSRSRARASERDYPAGPHSRASTGGLSGRRSGMVLAATRLVESPRLAAGPRRFRDRCGDSHCGRTAHDTGAQRRRRHDA